MVSLYYPPVSVVTGAYLNKKDTFAVEKDDVCIVFKSFGNLTRSPVEDLSRFVQMNIEETSTVSYFMCLPSKYGSVQLTTTVTVTVSCLVVTPM